MSEKSDSDRIIAELRARLQFEIKARNECEHRADDLSNQLFDNYKWIITLEAQAKTLFEESLALSKSSELSENLTFQRELKAFLEVLEKMRQADKRPATGKSFVEFIEKLVEKEDTIAKLTARLEEAEATVEGLTIENRRLHDDTELFNFSNEENSHDLARLSNLKLVPEEEAAKIAVLEKQMAEQADKEDAMEVEAAQQVVDANTAAVCKVKKFDPCAIWKI